jgi:hypothetical protein
MRQAIISVKGGHVGVNYVRDLRGVIEREDAEIGVLISMGEPTGPMRTEALAAGYYRSGSEGVGTWGKYPRIQLLTIRELLEGKNIDRPTFMGGSLTFPHAPKAQRPTPKSSSLF